MKKLKQENSINMHISKFLFLISFVIFVVLNLSIVVAQSVVITSEDPTVVDPSFTPKIGSEIATNIEAYIGRTSSYTGEATNPTADPLLDTIKWKVTVIGPSALTADMVDLDEVGFDDTDGEGINIETFHYPFSVVDGNLIAIGSCDDPDPEHSNECTHDIGFSLDQNDIFINADKIKFNSNAPDGSYTITYTLVDTKGTSDTIDDEVLSNAYSNTIIHTSTITVCSDCTFTAIQAAIDAATAGDTINVASGNYDEDGIEILTEGISIIGPGIEEGVERAYFTILESCAFPAAPAALHIHANDVTLSGLDIDGNGCDHVVHIGDLSEIQVHNANVSNNAIHNGGFGVTISWGSSNDPELPDIISNNEIYENNVGVVINTALNNIISYNNIHDNNNEGILLVDCWEFGPGSCGAFFIENNSILYNTISNNGIGGETGILIENGGSNNLANYNQISGNIIGVENQDENTFDATRNYWGSETGPNNPTTNPDGTGDSVSDNVDYSPWYTNEDMTSLDNTLIDNEDGTKSAELTEETELTNSGDNEVVVTIPAGTTVTGSSDWDGIINPPTIKANESITVTASDGNDISSVDSVIEVGFSGIRLTFDKAVRLLIPGQAGKLAGYSVSGGDFTPITTICNLDDQTWADDNLQADSECKIDVGDDLVIWTKHFTNFVTYTETATLDTPALLSTGGGRGSPAINAAELQEETTPTEEIPIPATTEVTPVVEQPTTTETPTEEEPQGIFAITGAAIGSLFDGSIKSTLTILVIVAALVVASVFTFSPRQRRRLRRMFRRRDF